MKIIDILNKINNNEEVPEKIKFDNTIFEFNEDKKEYIHKLDDWCSETLLFKVMNENTYFIKDLLKAEVEVIEEKKEIEELDYEIKSKNLDIYINENKNKINEIIRKINKEREEK